MISNLKRFVIRYRYFVGGALVVLVALGGFFIWRANQPTTPAGQTIPIQGSGTTLPGGILSVGKDISLASIRLSEGKAHPQAAASIPLAAGDPLSPEEIQQIISR